MGILDRVFALGESTRLIIIGSRKLPERRNFLPIGGDSFGRESPVFKGGDDRIIRYFCYSKLVYSGPMMLATGLNIPSLERGN
jgi:hypothetical protein